MRKFTNWSDLIIKCFPEENITSHSGKNITFQITDACNLKCSYCYQINKGFHTMSFDTAKKFIDLLLNNDDNTKLYIDSKSSSSVIIDFIGGEPLLEVELIDKIIDYFMEQMILRDHPWQYRHKFSLCSNGVLYFEPKVQDFLKKHAHHLSFSISIDGNKKLHDSCRVFPDGSGSYDIAIAAVHDWQKKYSIESMGSKMTLAPNNIQYTYEAIKGLLDENYYEINLNCIFEEGWTVEHAKIFYDQLKQTADYLLTHDEEYINDRYISIFIDTFFKPKSLDDTQNWCGGNGSMIAVDYKGDIYPCIRYMESSLGSDVPPIIIGNVDHGIMTTEEERKMGKMVQDVNRITQSSQECLECPIAEGCSWCQAYNYQCSGGNINKRATYICVMHKARALANCYYWNKYYHQFNKPYRFKLWLPDEEALKIISNEELEMLHKLEKE